MEVKDRLAHLLPHWIEHNDAHVGQLDEWAAKARSAGMAGTAEALEEARDSLRRASVSLAEARDRLRQEHAPGSCPGR